MRTMCAHTQCVQYVCRMQKKNAMSATTSPFHKNAWILWGGHDEHTFAGYPGPSTQQKLRIAVYFTGS